jgi:RHS repeat-associated protein
VGRLLAASRFDAVGSEIRRAVTIVYARAGNGSRVLRRVEDPATGAATTADVFDTLRLEGAAFVDADGDYERTARTEQVYLATAAGVLGKVRFVSPDAPSGTNGRTRAFFVLGDQLGSTSFVIDRETGELVERATYEAFGATEADYRPERWGSFREGYRHTGHADEVEIGLVDFGARYYIPSLGRWASPDPLTVHGLAGDMNAYAFVRGSPMRFVDPVGLDTFGCDNLSPGCDPGLGEQFPGDPGVGSGPAAGGGGSGGGGSGGAGGGGSPTRPVTPKPPAPITAAQSWVTTPEAEYDTRGANASSAGGIPTTGQVAVPGYEEALAKKYPGIAPYIYGKENEEIFMAIAPLLIPGPGESIVLRESALLNVNRAEEIAISLYNNAAPKIRWILEKNKAVIGAATRDGTSVVATNNPAVYRELLEKTEAGAVSLGPNGYLGSPPIRSGAIPHPDWSRTFVDAETQAEYELRTIFDLSGPGTASSFPVPGCPFCVPWLGQKGIVHLNPSPAAPTN